MEAIALLGLRSDRRRSSDTSESEMLPRPRKRSSISDGMEGINIGGGPASPPSGSGTPVNNSSASGLSSSSPMRPEQPAGRTRVAKFISYDPQQAQRTSAVSSGGGQPIAPLNAAGGLLLFGSGSGAVATSGGGSPATSRQGSPEPTDASPAPQTLPSSGKYQPKTLLPRDKHDLAIWMRSLVWENPLVTPQEVEEKLRKFSNNWAGKEYPQAMLFDYVWNTVTKRELAALRTYLQSFITKEMLQAHDLTTVDALANCSPEVKDAIFEEFAVKVLADQERSPYSLQKSQLKKLFLNA